MENWKFYQKYKKKDWISDILNENSDLYLFVKNGSIEHWRNAAKGFLTLLGVDELYKAAVIKLIAQFQKNLEKKRFWILSLCDDNDTIFKKIKERIANNMSNKFDSKRKDNFLNVDKNLMDDHNSKTINTEIDKFEIDKTLNQIAKNDKNLIKKALKTIYLDIDFEDFQDLCKKYELKISDVLGFEPKLQVNCTKTSNNQLELVF